MQEYTVRVFNSHTEWYQNEKLHRVDGPAVDCTNGSKYWYQYGNRHRVDGPAVETARGHQEWWIGGKFFKSEAEFNLAINPKPTCDNTEIVIAGVRYRLTKID
jgi:hypothetical protein